MSFKDGDWSARFEKMGDEAEAMFENICDDVLDRRYVRYGLNRPPIQMSSIPARIRYTPDYLMSGKFVEVQGFGRDQTLKLKVDKMGALHWWQDVMPVEMFVWDSKNARYAFVALSGLDALLDAGEATLERFPENKSYFAFSADALGSPATPGGTTWQGVN